MSTTTPAPTSNSTAMFSEAMLTGPKTMLTVTRSCEQVMAGMLSALLRQVEFSRDLVAGHCEDLELLAKARTPETLVQAELQVIQRRTERVLHGAQHMAEQIRYDWTTTLGAAEAILRPSNLPTAPLGKAA